MSKLTINRRGLLRSGAALGAGLAAPTFFHRNAWAQSHTNMPQGQTVTLGFNVPQTGSYAEEGADQLRALQLAVKHLNGDDSSDGGMMNTFSSKALKGNGILGKKVEFVTGDT
ncbi:MAG: branched-chain amino acid ABC transporter substrate-binding protein, partial [Pseudomonadota bacterium]